MLRAAALTLMLALASTVSLAQTPTAPAPASMPPLGAPLTLEQARAVMAAATAEARRQNWTMAIAVVEPSGALVAFERLDGTQYGSMQVSQAKARAAALYRRPTLVWQQQLAAGRLVGLTLPEVVASEGGVPLVLNGRMVGAIGVSGGTGEQDGVVAAAGAAALR